ncbi:MAG TPA: lipopolysaccharide biosynthesis protein [Gemmatimonadales bacterium]|nr:lipopolysaccharide biosynthesis protein [Gemmatimonadales bacterium]
MKRAEGSLTRRTITGMLWTAWGKGAYAGLQLLVLAVMARLITPAEFGVVSAALVVIGFSTVFSQLGLGPALVQRSALERRHLDTTFTTSVLFGVLLGGVLWLAAPAVAQLLRIDGVQPVVRALAWIFPLQSFGIVAESLLRRELRFQWLANLDVAAYAIGYGLVGIALALAGWGVWALVAGQIAQGVVRTGVLLVQRPPRLERPFEMRAFQELLYFGGGFTVARAANYVAVQGDNMVVGRFLGPQALGFYGRAYSLMSAPAYAFGTVLDQVLFPAMAKVQHDPERLATAYRRGVALLALLVLAPSAALLLLGPEFIAVVLGRRWAPAVTSFQILTIGMLFRTSYKMSDSLARSTGAVYRRAWRQIFYAVLVLLGAWIGQHWGIAGVAWGALAALTVNFFLMAQLSLSVTGTTWRSFWEAHLPAVRLTAASFPIVWVATLALRHWGLPPLAVLGAAAGVAAASVVVLCLRGPHLFLGRDGLWVLEELRQLSRWRSAATPPPPVAQSPAYQATDVGDAR